jgi:hypothetical protein
LDKKTWKENIKNLVKFFERRCIPEPFALIEKRNEMELGKTKCGWRIRKACNVGNLFEVVIFSRVMGGRFHLHAVRPTSIHASSACESVHYRFLSYLHDGP